MAKDYKRLGEMLIEAELITATQLEQAIKEQKKSGRLIGAVLTSLGFVSEREMMQVLQRQLALPLVDLTDVAVDEQRMGVVAAATQRAHDRFPRPHRGVAIRRKSAEQHSDTLPGLHESRVTLAADAVKKPCHRTAGSDTCGRERIVVKNGRK